MRRPMLRLLFSLILILSSCAWVAQVTSAQPAAPIGQIVDVTQFGAAGDAKQVTDGVAAANSTMLTSATASFTAADVGKTIYVRGAGSTGADFQTTIAAVTHSTTITMTLAASTSVNSAVVIWGTDNTPAIQNALNSATANSTVLFPPGDYGINGRVILRGSDGSKVSLSRVQLLGGPQVRLMQMTATQGYPSDALTIGDPDAANGGTGTAINISDIKADGFECINARICVWAVYGNEVLVENIKADKIAVVAAGNDASDNCKNVTFRNITRTAAWTPLSGFYTAAVFSTTGFRMENIISPFSVFGSAVVVKTSTLGTIDGVFIDQQGFGNGIQIIDGAQYVSVNNFVIQNTNDYAVGTFDSNGTTRPKYSSFTNGVVRNCVSGIYPQGGNSLFSGILTVGCTNSVKLANIDAGGNVFVGNFFSEGTLNDPSGGKATAQQTWISNYGLPTATGVPNLTRRLVESSGGALLFGTPHVGGAAAGDFNLAEGAHLNAYFSAIAAAKGLIRGATLGGVRSVQVSPSGLPTTFGGAVQGLLITLTYGATVNTDAETGNIFQISVTNRNTFTIVNPTNPLTGQTITYRIINQSGGAMGAVTWGSAYKLAAWTSPVNGFSRTIWFQYNGSNWIEIARTMLDVPN